MRPRNNNLGIWDCTDIDYSIQFLLIEHSRTKFWDIPKGHPENEETPKETTLREVLEETNYNIKIEADFSESIQYILPRGEDKQVIFFLGNAINKGCHEVNPDEISCVRWFDFEEAKKIITFDNSKEVLKKAYSFLVAQK